MNNRVKFYISKGVQALSICVILIDDVRREGFLSFFAVLIFGRSLTIGPTRYNDIKSATVRNAPDVQSV